MFQGSLYAWYFTCSIHIDLRSNVCWYTLHRHQRKWTAFGHSFGTCYDCLYEVKTAGIRRLKEKFLFYGFLGWKFRSVGRPFWVLFLCDPISLHYRNLSVSKRLFLSEVRVCVPVMVDQSAKSVATKQRINVNIDGLTVRFDFLWMSHVQKWNILLLQNVTKKLPGNENAPKEQSFCFLAR